MYTAKEQASRIQRLGRTATIPSAGTIGSLESVRNMKRRK